MGESKEAQFKRLIVLGSFLRLRREAANLSEFKLDNSRKRRTSGLLREEVARLAHMSESTYTKIEQGVLPSVNAETARGIAEALRLNEFEQQYVLSLAGLSSDHDLHDPVLASAEEIELLDFACEMPAHLINRRFDILASNDGFKALFPMLDGIPQHEQNLVRLTFTHPDARALFVDWDYAAALIVGQFRNSARSAISTPRYESLVNEMRETSPEFRNMWKRGDVNPSLDARRRYNYPETGEFSLRLTKLSIEPKREIALVVQTAPADSPYWKLFTAYKEAHKS
jgi:transcriptional regulator with XRE-family HTH domain